jgi:hypothetical protein
VHVLPRSPPARALIQVCIVGIAFEIILLWVALVTLELRPFRPDDAVELHEIFSDPRNPHHRRGAVHVTGPDRGLDQQASRGRAAARAAVVRRRSADQHPVLAGICRVRNCRRWALRSAGDATCGLHGLRTRRCHGTRRAHKERLAPESSNAGPAPAGITG